MALQLVQPTSHERVPGQMDRDSYCDDQLPRHLHASSGHREVTAMRIPYDDDGVMCFGPDHSASLTRHEGSEFCDLNIIRYSEIDGFPRVRLYTIPGITPEDAYTTMSEFYSAAGFTPFVMTKSAFES